MAEKKREALKEEEIRIRTTTRKDIDRFQEAETSSSTSTENCLRNQVEEHLHKTELMRYLDKEQEKALATLRDEVKQNPNVELADDDIDRLLEVHCALSVARPLERVKNAKEKVYGKLGDREFRLLVLSRAPNKYHPLIACLQKATFEEKKSPYAALSYSWGKPSADHHVYLLPQGTNRIEDSFSHTIHENLFCALHRLRRSDRDVTLWVDALCIDQTDKGEKTRQLGCMVDIYGQADMVCIWLGESDNEGRSDKAMKFIPQLVDMATLDANTDDKEHAYQWAALSELTRDPWFARRWIVQEISLAKKAVVYCGEKVVHWDMLVDAIALLAANEERVKALFDPSKWRYGRNTLGEIQFSSANILLDVISNLFPTTEDRNGHKPLKSLEYLVTALQTFDASDPRDLIYALVHISRDYSEDKITMGRQSAEEQSKPRLHIDYGTRIADVFMQFTKFCVDTSGSLDIICRPWAKEDESQPGLGDGLTERSSLPSWVPLLKNAEFGGPGQSHKGRKNGRSFVGAVDQPIYNASGHMEADGVIFEPKTMSMKVSGLLLGTVGDVSPRCCGGVVFRESLSLGGWQGIENGSKGVPAQIWRTLVADRTSNGLRPPLWYQRACLRSLELADMFSGGDLNTIQLSDEVVFVRDYLKRVREVTWNRCFFKAARRDDEPSDKKGATGDGEADVEPPAPNVSDEVPDLVVENVDQDQSEANPETVSSIPVGEKPTQDHEAIERVGQEEPVEDSEEVDNPNLLSSNSDPETQKVTTGPLVESKERNISYSLAGESNSKRSSDWLGICPSSTQKDDQVCILFGCSVPVILRPVEQGVYELVGEAYVYGVMDGEEIPLDKESLERQTQTFDIR